MEYTHLKFEFKGGAVIHDFPMNKDITIDCPNKYGGIGEITLKGKCRLYSGQWFSCKSFGSNFSNLRAVYMVSLSDEIAPKLIWKVSDRKFSYVYWRMQAGLLTKKLSALKRRNIMEKEELEKLLELLKKFQLVKYPEDTGTSDESDLNSVISYIKFSLKGGTGTYVRTLGYL